MRIFHSQGSLLLRFRKLYTSILCLNFGRVVLLKTTAFAALRPDHEKAIQSAKQSAFAFASIVDRPYKALLRRNCSPSRFPLSNRILEAYFAAR